eukprot:363941-Chlamydomonas_euryale.AAC.16
MLLSVWTAHERRNCDYINSPLRPGGGAPSHRAPPREQFAPSPRGGPPNSACRRCDIASAATALADADAAWRKPPRSPSAAALPVLRVVAAASQAGWSERPVTITFRSGGANRRERVRRAWHRSAATPQPAIPVPAAARRHLRMPLRVHMDLRS